MAVSVKELLGYATLNSEMMFFTRLIEALFGGRLGSNVTLTHAVTGQVMAGEVKGINSRSSVSTGFKCATIVGRS